MPVSLDEFCKQVSQLGVISEQELTNCREESSAAGTSDSAKELAKSLVRRKGLTVFQAQQIYNGKSTGLVLGNYLILDKLGQGGMGVVFKALHRRMDRVVAVKVLAPSLVQSSQSLARFHREIKAVAKLEHPNIVTAYDADEANEIHFLVMQYVDGQDLASLVKTKGPLSLPQTVQIITQVAQGLSYAHQQGVVHRDIKPANLLINRHRVVQILDLGLARIQNASVVDDVQLTQSGHVMGTVDYMAPEQAMNTRDADTRADIYSLGATFWYLVTAQPMYTGETMVQKLIAHQNASLRNLQDVRPEASRALAQLWQRLVAKRPEDRPQTMAEVIGLLSQCEEFSSDKSLSQSLSLATASSGNLDPQAATMKVDQSLIDTSVSSIPLFQVQTPPKNVSKKRRAASTTKRTPTYFAICASLISLGLFAGSYAFLTRDHSTQLPDPISAASPPTRQPVPKQPVPNQSAEATTVTSILDDVTTSLGPTTTTSVGRSLTEPSSASSPATNQTVSVATNLAPATTTTVAATPSTQSMPVPTPIMAPATSTSDLEASPANNSSWTVLFDGREVSHWSTLGPFRVESGLLVARGGRSNAVSKESFANFELEAIWKIGPGANSGIYYRSTPSTDVKAGIEYQIADHESDPQAYPPVNQTGGLYGVIAPPKGVMNRIGQWNTTRIVCKGSTNEHWLNGQLLLTYDTASGDFSRLEDVSRLKGQIEYQPSGHILLQSISGECQFRSIRIRMISP